MEETIRLITPGALFTRQCHTISTHTCAATQSDHTYGHFEAALALVVPDRLLCPTICLSSALPGGPPRITKTEESALHHFRIRILSISAASGLKVTYCYFQCVSPGFQPEGPPRITKTEESALHHLRIRFLSICAASRLKVTYC